MTQSQERQVDSGETTDSSSMQALREESLEEKLNRDTARIDWLALAQFQQQKAVIEVDQQLDLIEVACHFARDDHAQVKQWLANSSVRKVDDELSQVWKDENREVWAVVVAPWVLVQIEKPS